MLVITLVGCSRGAADRADADADFSAVRIPETLTEQSADLVIEGRVKRGGKILLDLETIMRYPAKSFTSTDPWDRELHGYTGVPFFELLKHLGIEEGADAVRVKARNGYEVDIRLEDLKDYRYLLAYRIDGKLPREEEGLTRRGDLMIAIDFDEHEELDPEVYKHHLVWQANRVVVL